MGVDAVVVSRHSLDQVDLLDLDLSHVSAVEIIGLPVEAASERVAVPIRADFTCASKTFSLQFFSIHFIYSFSLFSLIFPKKIRFEAVAKAGGGGNLLERGFQTAQQIIVKVSVWVCVGGRGGGCNN